MDDITNNKSYLSNSLREANNPGNQNQIKSHYTNSMKSLQRYPTINSTISHKCRHFLSFLGEIAIFPSAFFFILTGVFTFIDSYYSFFYISNHYKYSKALIKEYLPDFDFGWNDENLNTTVESLYNKYTKLEEIQADTFVFDGKSWKKQLKEHRDEYIRWESRNMTTCSFTTTITLHQGDPCPATINVFKTYTCTSTTKRARYNCTGNSDGRPGDAVCVEISLDQINSSSRDTTRVNRTIDGVYYNKNYDYNAECHEYEYHDYFEYDDIPAFSQFIELDSSTECYEPYIDPGYPEIFYDRLDGLYDCTEFTGLEGVYHSHLITEFNDRYYKYKYVKLTAQDIITMIGYHSMIFGDGRKKFFLVCICLSVFQVVAGILLITWSRPRFEEEIFIHRLFLFDTMGMISCSVNTLLLIIVEVTLGESYFIYWGEHKWYHYAAWTCNVGWLVPMGYYSYYFVKWRDSYIERGTPFWTGGRRMRRRTVVKRRKMSSDVPSVKAEERRSVRVLMWLVKMNFWGRSWWAFERDLTLLVVSLAGICTWEIVLLCLCWEFSWFKRDNKG